MDVVKNILTGLGMMILAIAAIIGVTAIYETHAAQMVAGGVAALFLIAVGLSGLYALGEAFWDFWAGRK
jgi:hypothetical protein